MERYLTFDVGTTAIKTCVFDENLKMLASCNDEYQLLTADDKTELEPEVYWSTIKKAIQTISQTQSLAGIQAICLTTQGETMIPVDQEGNSLHNAIVWLDGRAEKQAQEILAVKDHEAMFQTTGLPEINGFVPLAKFLWFKEEKPEIYAKTHKFLLLEDYLIYRLSGKLVSEKSLLTSTAWFDIRKDEYDTQLLKKLGLDADKLPEAVECGTIVGTLTEKAASELGLSPAVKVIAGAMDQIAAAIGGGGLHPGIVTATVGTAMAMTCTVPEKYAFRDDVMTVYRGYKKGQFVFLPYSPTAGAVFTWLKNTVFPLDAEKCKAEGSNIYDVLCDMADTVPAGAGGVTLIPYFAGSTRPKNMPDAKGVFFGIDLGTTREILIRATLESIGNMIRENLEMLRSFGAEIQTMPFFGGGSTNLKWNQIIADIADVTLIKPEEKECASLGAAILAACALGDQADIRQAQSCNPIIKTVTPDADNKAVYDEAYDRYQKLLNTVASVYC